ncbi:ABC-type glycerol-3-phosphate transport system permease component [Caldalkalibacillus uzonensis]|uniref:ABC-type glycerol-3-phosphate transport system permease component n=1 Tax=Caldalkalibacillus uzonensis TaxID=353224 RepID=A0ABU0CQR6_9BACI|nr:carbohydrate ABC transporter permease [Caldalkalibacillus uzonensis]MDQ0338752.1 ABC-type glycerol-3-phosphate transport system permease component [Caldalkalibacillus uzonensis]
MINKLRQYGLVLFLWFVSLIFLVPLYWLFVSSVKSDAEITRFPPTFWPENFHWSNFVEVWSRLNFTQTFMNSIIVSTSTTILIVIFSTMAAYALSKKRIIGRNMILLVLVGTMTVPPTALLLPLYFIITKMGMYDTLISLILPFGVTVFGIFFMKQYMDDVPDELIEAARMDGCGDVRIFLQIIVPLVKPALVTLVLIEFVNNWNSFTMPLVLLQSESKYTLPLRLGLLASENVALPWSQILAANLLTIIPVVVLFLLLQKQFIKGIMEGAVKG